MADPVSLGLLAVGLVGSAVAAGGAAEAGQSQSEASAYQAQVAANNATIAQTNAREDIQAGETAATNQGLKTKAVVGAETANLGASGVVTTSGSAAKVTTASKELGYLDALTLRSNAAKQAYGQEVQATSDTAQSRLDTMQSGQASEAGTIGATGTLLSGVSTVGAKFAGLQNSSSPGAPTSTPYVATSDTAIY
jgi:hypothetical protein